MAEPLVLQHSRTYPVALETAYDAIIAHPLTEIFDRRYLLIPPDQGRPRAVRAVGERRGDAHHRARRRRDDG